MSDGNDRCAQFRQTRPAFDRAVRRWTTHIRFSPVLAFFPRTYLDRSDLRSSRPFSGAGLPRADAEALSGTHSFGSGVPGDRKSTRLNSSHSQISYAVFCLKKKKHTGEDKS